MQCCPWTGDIHELSTALVIEIKRHAATRSHFIHILLSSGELQFWHKRDVEMMFVKVESPA